MKNPPLSFTPDLFESIDIGNLATELTANARGESDGKAARTLVKSPQLTVVLMVMRANARLVEHAAPGPLLVIPVAGEVIFTAAQNASRAEVADASTLALGPGLRHEVEARTDAAFLLVIGGRS